VTVEPVVHVIGAGLAGLSSAVRLAEAGRKVRVYEAAGHAGGRCRSYADNELGRRIDNGNHLLLSGNRAAHEYLQMIGAADSLGGPEAAVFPFFDLATGERWSVRPNAGPVPWWICVPSRRAPGTGAVDYLRAVRLARAGSGATVASCLGAGGNALRRFWEPLAVAVLNTPAEDGAAALLWPVVRETFGRGEAACRPRIARAGLSESFIDPAVLFLEGRNCPVLINHRIRELTRTDNKVSALDLGSETVTLGDGDAVVLAVPPAVAASLLPDLTVPEKSRAIVNGHFQLDRQRDDISFLGLVGGTAQWLFVRGDIASVTVSAADGIADEPSGRIAERLWREVAAALELGDAPLPRRRIVKEKRATFDQSPGQAARRPATLTAWRNLFLAGDWTDTGLPATIESAVRSGEMAAAAVTPGPGNT